MKVSFIVSEQNENFLRSFINNYDFLFLRSTVCLYGYCFSTPPVEKFGKTSKALRGGDSVDL